MLAPFFAPACRLARAWNYDCHCRPFGLNTDSGATVAIFPEGKKCYCEVTVTVYGGS